MQPTGKTMIKQVGAQWQKVHGALPENHSSALSTHIDPAYTETHLCFTFYENTNRSCRRYSSVVTHVLGMCKAWAQSLARTEGRNLRTPVSLYPHQHWWLSIFLLLLLQLLNECRVVSYHTLVCFS